MDKGKLQTIVLGLKEEDNLLLKAALDAGSFEIVAVADTDINLAGKTAELFQCGAFDDYRQLITSMDSSLRPENRCLIVAAGTHSCAEHIRLAMKKKFNILKLPPAARDFEEAMAFVKLAEEEEIKFAIANPNRYSDVYVALRRLLEQNDIEPFLMKVFCSFDNIVHTSWQSDPKLAGGGVLLHNCYDMLDEIILNFSMPEQVYSLQTNQAHDKRQRLYLTEDTAIVTMKFSDTFIGNIIASRRDSIMPKQNCMKLYGKDKMLTVSETQLTMTDNQGEICEQVSCNNDKHPAMVALLKDYARAIVSDEKLTSSAKENLTNMAVMTAAYISARTGFPEEPGRILQMPSGTTG